MILLTANVPVSKAEANSWRGSLLLLLFFFYPAYCARLRLEFNQAPGGVGRVGRGGWCGGFMDMNMENGKWGARGRFSTCQLQLRGALIRVCLKSLID